MPRILQYQRKTPIDPFSTPNTIPPQLKERPTKKLTQTHLKNNPPNLARRLRHINRALIEGIRRDSQQLGSQLDRAAEFVLRLGRFTLVFGQRVGRLEEMPGVGVRHCRFVVACVGTRGVGCAGVGKMKREFLV